MKLEFFKKEKKFRKGGFHTNPDICWEIVLYVAFAVVVGILVYSVFLFKEIDQGFSAEDAELNSESKSVNKAKLDKTLQYFSVREEKAIQILKSPSPIVDPSL